MKLNLGCGFDKREGWLNVDRFAACEPDKLIDLEATPWDLPDSGFEHVLLKHVLEHLGADFAVFSAIMQELYRITTPGGVVEIHVPHLRHDSFWTDPSHVRAFTPQTFFMFSKRLNRKWIAEGANDSPLGLMLDVDFEPEDVQQAYDPAWAARIRAGEVTQEQAYQLSRERWNVLRELQVKLRAVK